MESRFPRLEIFVTLCKNTNTATGASPAQISTSFCNIAHLLVLISHYLALRLPAEITLPHRNYPTPTIFSPAKSYLSRDASTDRSSVQSSYGAATPRTSDSRHHARRPRPLYLDKSLPKLAKEDPGTYTLFLEGATLLAWDLSWLCRTQGLNLTSDSWEDVCDMGKNIWQLMVVPPVQASTLMKAYASRDVSSKTKNSKDAPKPVSQRAKAMSMLGHYSHGTAHSFLSSSEGTNYMRSWKLPTSTKVIDKLKSTFLGEMASAEWELLEEKEWDETQDSVQPPQEPRSADEQEHARELGLDRSSTDYTAIVSASSSGKEESRPEDLNGQPPSGRLKGASGWTKLRSR